MTYGTISADLISTSTGRTIGASSSATMKNRILNGDMRIDQRNNGASITPTTSQYSVDRWLANLTVASLYSAQQTTSAPAGFTNSLLATSLSAHTATSGDYESFQQRIEAYNMQDAGWGTANAKTFTLSFWVQSSLTGTFGGSVYFPGSVVVRSYPFSYSIPTANTWTYVSIVIPGDTFSNTAPTTNNLYAIIQWALCAGSNYETSVSGWQSGNYLAPTGTVNILGTSGATFYLTGVQLEVGTVASSFDYRDYGRELIMCQRYYEYGNFRIDGYGASGTRLSTTYGYKANKRINPTVTFTGTGFINGSGVGIDGASDVYGFIGYFSVTSTGGAAMATGWNSSAEL